MIQDILQVIVLLIRALLAVVLVAAGAAKLADTRSFAATLRGLKVPLGRGFLLRGLALGLPLVEVGAGIAVVTGFWSTIINGIVLVLMGSFSIVVVIALSMKLNVACRCFGTLSDSQFSPKGLVRSLLLTILAGVVFWAGNTYEPALNLPLGAVVPLVAGYLLFALAAAQAAKTIAILKERTA
ncbi:MAG TPA: MauE/DoxX family redox-associated membrane protein [Ktedonobacteraceae bacterium]|jgi:uncharacterized membrane protein YphA (DoxX/SURF4 family)|nr:MauE/DoxX family redox-associated membrane protein [Ktedonobacteraceae bacterium]